MRDFKRRAYSRAIVGEQAGKQRHNTLIDRRTLEDAAEEITNELHFARLTPFLSFLRFSAAIAASAKVDTLVFTHMVPPPNSPQIEQAFTRGVSDIFKGKVVLGTDGMRFDLPPRN